MNVKYVIVGAGPAGLAFAATLLKHGETSFVVLEKENEAGGLCRSTHCGGAPLDIGGGHILDVRKKHVLDFLFGYMPLDEWNYYRRNTNIVVGQHVVSYPFEANIWQLPLEEQVEYLESIVKASLSQAQEKPDTFVDWIYWKLGDRIAENYMIPYNQKMWSIDLNQLGTYWLEKLPSVSFRETLISCLTHKPYGELPAHAEFYYPKQYGYGEVFSRIAKSLDGYIRYSTAVTQIDEHNLVNGTIKAEHVIMAAPWHEIASSLPAQAQDLVERLQYTSVDIDYYPEASTSDAHWTYYADPSLSYHRTINRDNIIAGSKGHWTETNAKRRAQPGAAHFENQYAYPINTLDKPQAIRELLEMMKKRNIHGLGRWGEWEHMNSDVAVERGMALATQMMEGRG